MNSLKRFLLQVIAMMLAVYCAITLVFVQDDEVQTMLCNAFTRRHRVARRAQSR